MDLFAHEESKLMFTIKCDFHFLYKRLTNKSYGSGISKIMGMISKLMHNLQIDDFLVLLIFDGTA